MEYRNGREAEVRCGLHGGLLRGQSNVISIRFERQLSGLVLISYNLTGSRNTIIYCLAPNQLEKRC